MKLGTKVECHRGGLKGRVGTVVSAVGKRDLQHNEMVVQIMKRKVIVSKLNWVAK
jgi:ribosomal protein L24